MSNDKLYYELGELWLDIAKGIRHRAYDGAPDNYNDLLFHYDRHGEIVVSN